MNGEMTGSALRVAFLTVAFLAMPPVQANYGEDQG